MGVKRDFIPEGGATEAEKHAYEMQRARVKGGVIADFVPDEGHVLGKPSTNPSDDAIERALAAQETSIAADFEAATFRLAQLSDAEAVATIQSMSPERRDLFLIAEAAAGARPTILNSFPAPDPSLVLLYTGSFAGTPETYMEAEAPEVPDLGTDINGEPVTGIDDGREDVAEESPADADSEPVAEAAPEADADNPVDEDTPAERKTQNVPDGIEVPDFGNASFLGDDAPEVPEPEAPAEDAAAPAAEEE